MNDVPNLNETGVSKSEPESSGYKSKWSDSWENYKKGGYYQRVVKIMLDYGMGSGDVENILANLWEDGWFVSKFYHDPIITDYEKRIQHVRDAWEIQGMNGNWNYSEYMHGMYNALEFAMAILENHDTNYKSQPEEWICNETSDKFRKTMLQAVKDL